MQNTRVVLRVINELLNRNYRKQYWEDIRKRGIHFINVLATPSCPCRENDTQDSEGHGQGADKQIKSSPHSSPIAVLVATLFAMLQGVYQVIVLRCQMRCVRREIPCE